jgi:hypothetical protein
MPDHPRVVVRHPIASMTKAEVIEMAERFVAEVVRGLTTSKP